MTEDVSVNEIPRLIVWESITLTEESAPVGDRSELLLKRLKTIINPPLGDALITDQEGISKNFVFRGFTRRKNCHERPGTLGQILHDPDFASHQLSEKGYKLTVEDGDVLKVTKRPTVALTFADPRVNQIGFFAIYDDSDNFFGELVNWEDRERAAEIRLQRDSSLRDRLVGVIQLEHQPKNTVWRFLKKLARQVP